MTPENKARILALVRESKEAAIRGNRDEALRLLTSAIYLMD